MDEKHFWDVIDAACRPSKSDREWRDALHALLIQLSPREIGNYACWVEAKAAALNTMDLFGALWLIQGCRVHPDAFLYFRHWLIGKGKKACEAAIVHADNLADILVVGESDGAEIFSVARDAWRAVSAWPETDYPDDSWMVRPPNCCTPPWTSEPEGENWDFDDDAEVRKRLPRLAAMYLDAEDQDE